jgi:DeoR/GlpR family transcriptional regulator of sugar metabolism
VIVDNHEIMTMMIPKLPHHKNLKLITNSIVAFEERVDRTNAKTKCLGLYENSGMLIKELYYTNMF